ncbi:MULTISPECIES: carboxypeptidase-like regulatory domain-containing protein [Sphingomonadaceae]|uniref:carboxypeptidase-like regulatory domain-containing protein n=1 Tax=Sphingomonadales TaxID=204457 RepID=UPI000372CE68|nr:MULTISPECIES: carboxypeptidase-like regulatory domain-containing protein [Sphingomonadaceae]MBN9146433.1 carboxypeptidase regulatory-like domain-containing protein [Novosphingobium sp.]
MNAQPRLWRVLLSCLLVLLLLRAGPAMAAAALLSADDALLFDARVGSLSVGNGIRGFTVEDAICLDMGDVIDALKIAVVPSEDKRRAQGWAFDEARHIAIDRDTGEARFGTEYMRLGANDIHDSRSGWCVDTQALGRWLGVTFDADTTNAILTITSSAPLPIEAALRRTAAAERLATKTQPQTAGLERHRFPYRLWRMPALDASLAAGWQRDAKGAQVRTTRYEMLASGELAYASAEARLASDANAMPDSLRLRLYRADPDGQLLGPLAATQAAIGDVDSFAIPLVAGSASGRGVALTNRPLDAIGEFDKVALTGLLPQGWDAELYRNGELLRVVPADANGRYAFRDIALRHGVNVLEVVRYGPQGQVRRERRVYNIAAQSPGPGETWWSTNIVQGNHDLLRFGKSRQTPASGWRGSMAVDHGLGRGTSIGAAIIRAPSSDGSADYGHLNLRGGLGGMLGEVSWAGRRGGGSATRASVVGDLFKTSIAVEAVHNRGLRSERMDPALRSYVGVALDRPVHAAGLILPLHFDLRSTRQQSGQGVEANGRLSVATRSVAASLVGGWSRFQSSDGMARESATAGLLVSGRAGKVRLRGEVHWRLKPDPTLMGVQLTANRALGATDMVQISANYAAGEKKVAIDAAYARDFGPAALTLNLSGDSRRAVAIGLGLTFSVGPGANGRFGRVRSASQARGGGLLVRAFRDLDGNGQRDAGEPPFADPVGVLVNDLPLPARLRGEEARDIELDGLSPATPIKIALDEASLSDPFDIPSNPGVLVTPRAGLHEVVELGVSPSASVEGTLAVNGRALAGETIELLTMDGTSAYRARTEFDGMFSFERVRYGRYRLKVAQGRHPQVEQIVELGQARSMARLGVIDVGTVQRMAAR